MIDDLRTAEYVTRTLGGVRGALRQFLAEPSTRLYDGFITLNMNSKKKAQELFEKHGFEIANSIIDTMLDENLPEFNQSKIDFWLDVKNDLKRVALAVAS